MKSCCDNKCFSKRTVWRHRVGNNDGIIYMWSVISRAIAPPRFLGPCLLGLSWPVTLILRRRGILRFLLRKRALRNATPTIVLRDSALVHAGKKNAPYTQVYIKAPFLRGRVKLSGGLPKDVRISVLVIALYDGKFWELLSRHNFRTQIFCDAIRTE